MTLVTTAGMSGGRFSGARTGCCNGAPAARRLASSCRSFVFSWYCKTMGAVTAAMAIAATMVVLVLAIVINSRRPMVVWPRVVAAAAALTVGRRAAGAA